MIGSAAWITGRAAPNASAAPKARGVMQKTANSLATPSRKVSVDSCVGFALRPRPGGSAKTDYWIAAGKSYQEVRRLNEKVLTKSRSAWPPVPRLLAPVGVQGAGRLLAAARTDSRHVRPKPTDLAHADRQRRRDHRRQRLPTSPSSAATTYSYMLDARRRARRPRASSSRATSELSRAVLPLLPRNASRTNGYFLHKYTPAGHPRLELAPLDDRGPGRSCRSSRTRPRWCSGHSAGTSRPSAMSSSSSRCTAA